MEDAVEGQQLTSDQELQAECLMESMALSHLLQPILEGVSQCKMSRRVPCVNSVLAHQKLVLYISSCWITDEWIEILKWVRDIA